MRPASLSDPATTSTTPSTSTTTSTSTKTTPAGNTRWPQVKPIFSALSAVAIGTERQVSGSHESPRTLPRSQANHLQADPGSTTRIPTKSEDQLTNTEITPVKLAFSDHWLSKVENLLNNIAALGIFVLMIMATVQIVGRKLLNMPIPGYIDIAEQSIALFAFMGAAYCQRLNGHVRMELILSQLRGRLLWLLEATGTLVALVLIGIMIKYGFDHFLRAWNFGDSTIDIGLPVWPSKLVVPVAFSVLWLRLLLQFFGYCRLIRNPRVAPAFVPVTEDTRAQAEREAKDAAAATPDQAHG